MVEAAHRADVRVVVHTSVARAGDHENFIGWDEGRWEPLYWKNKAAVNSMVKAQGFHHWVILKPALIMEDLLPPMVQFMFPSLVDRGQFDSAITSSEDEMLARGEHAPTVSSQVWDNVEGYKVDLGAVRSWGVPLTTLDEFIEQHRDEFVIG